MKEKLLLAFLASFSLLSGAHAAGRIYAIKIHGMHCDACANTLRKKLSDLPGVASADVSLSEHQAIVTVHDGEDLDEAGVKKAILNAGYFAQEIRLTPLA